MCGIAGVVRVDRGSGLPLDELARMSAALARRGPDGAGEWVSPTRRAAFAPEGMSKPYSSGMSISTSRNCLDSANARA